MVRGEVLCMRCYTDSEPGAAVCRSCGHELAVNAEDKAAADQKKKAAEVARLKAAIQAKKDAEAQAAAEADAAKITDAELEDLRKQAEAAGVS